MKSLPTAKEVGNEMGARKTGVESMRGCVRPGVAELSSRLALPAGRYHILPVCVGWRCAMHAGLHG